MPSPPPTLPSVDPAAAAFAGLVDSRSINLELASPDLPGAIDEILSRLAWNSGVADLGRLREDILGRERLSASSLGGGIALPHARTSAVSSFVLAVGRHPSGIPGSPGEPIRLVFVLGSPRERIAEHLTVVASLARILSRAGFRERLLAAPDAAEFARILGAAP